ncbi:MAG TPA: hypothetical protein VGB22_04325 [candidate division Zixibacteria bacterium]
MLSPWNPCSRLTLRAAVIALSVFGLLSCSRPPWPSADEAGRDVRDRLNERAELTESATYRIRWEAVGTDPHGIILVDIAYQKPEKFWISAEGPFGLPSFTAVLVGDSFWYVDHQQEVLVCDLIDSLGRYNVPMPEFFSGEWRAIFSGGWGGHETIAGMMLGFLPGTKRNRYELASGGTIWTVDWHHGHRAPKSMLIETLSPDSTVMNVDVRFSSHRDRYPFWEIKRLIVKGLPGGGEHRWYLRRQNYNIAIPERYFRIPTPKGR